MDLGLKITNNSPMTDTEKLVEAIAEGLYWYFQMHPEQWERLTEER